MSDVGSLLSHAATAHHPMPPLFLSDLSSFFGSKMYLWLAVSESQTIFYGNSTTEANMETEIDFLEDQNIFAFKNIFEINNNNNSNSNEDFDNNDYDYRSQASLHMMFGFISNVFSSYCGSLVL